MTKEGRDKDEINARFDEYMKKRYIENEVRQINEKVNKKLKAEISSIYGERKSHVAEQQEGTLEDPALQDLQAENQLQEEKESKERKLKLVQQDIDSTIKSLKHSPNKASEFLINGHPRDHSIDRSLGRVSVRRKERQRFLTELKSKRDNSGNSRNIL